MRYLYFCESGGWNFVPRNIPSTLSHLQLVLLGAVHRYLHGVLKMRSAEDQTNSQQRFPIRACLWEVEQKNKAVGFDSWQEADAAASKLQSLQGRKKKRNF